jgi:hypothetical protein
MIVLSNVARKIIAGVAIEASLGAATAEPRGKVKYLIRIQDGLNISL